MKPPLRFIPRWRKELLRLWSVRMALLLAATNGLYVAWPAFQETMSPITFAGISIFLSMMIVVLRLIKQKDVTDDDDSEE
jgi:hypothetical protein